jgi:serine/threonine protein phosphatase 1
MQQTRRVAPPAATSPVEHKFSVLRRAGRVWAVAAIHGEAERLAAIHGAIEERFAEGDRLVYLGNYIGHGAAITATLDELLRFRRDIIARPRMFTSDLVYLRGSQEEMWHKLLQLQFAVNPSEVYDWMLAQGVDATIRAYGGDPQRGKVAMRDGAVAIGRWTGALRQAMTAQGGHRELMSALRRAAYTDDEKLLFVHAGLDPRRPLDEQGDALWWGHLAWSKLFKAPYGSFQAVVRGYGPGAEADPGPHALTLDGGCGFGGPLVAVCLDAGTGQVLERFEA